MVSAGLSGLSTPDCNLSTRQGPSPGNKPVGTEDMKDLGGKTKQQLPCCPAPMVQELPAQVSSGMKAGSTPALFGKGTP